eukprot:CAMPEP_0194479222 /NCGR_PEP_ID=MMETSP0253-20130528/2410_1 /TAXON_ID=2966 /ORGANISM="Noctiluca scintillans" /LENGTH=357 /DNA_ID=CAMNT_0039318407 /DNA_START=12 /DNA_END=1085 /DNA_ORIENTATION=+
MATRWGSGSKFCRWSVVRWSSFIVVSLLAVQLLLYPQKEMPSPSSGSLYRRHNVSNDLLSTSVNLSDIQASLQLHDVLLVSGSATCVLEKVVEGLRRHLYGLGSIHIVVPPVWLRVCESLGQVSCHNEDSVLNFNTTWLSGVSNALGWTPLASRRGWYYQQLLKLMAFQTIPLSHHFLLWDADNVLIRDYNPRHGERSRFITVRGVSLFKGQYLEAARALSGAPVQRYDVVAHQMPIEQPILHALVVHMCQNLVREACARHILDSIPPDASPKYALSEYLLYYTWVAAHHAHLVFTDTKSTFFRTRASKKMSGTAKDCAIADRQYPTNVFMVVLETVSSVRSPLEDKQGTTTDQNVF